LERLYCKILHDLLTFELIILDKVYKMLIFNILIC